MAVSRIPELTSAAWTKAACAKAARTKAACAAKRQAA